MSEEYFFTACSNDFLLNFHFFDRGESEKVYLNIKFDFGNNQQSLVCESMGYWLNYADLDSFRNAITEDVFFVELKDIDGNGIFSIKNSSDKLLLIHKSISENSASDSFKMEICINHDFIKELVLGLDGCNFKVQ